MNDRPRKILMIRPSALGDVARTVPVLVSLKRAHPQAEIDWLVNDRFAEVVAHHPDLHRVIPFPRKRFSRFGLSPTVTREVWRYCRELRNTLYDAVYDLQGLGRSGWLTWVTRSPHRVGAEDARELAWLAYNKRVYVPDECVHTVDRMLAVIEADGVVTIRDMRLYVGQDDRVWAESFFEQNSIAPSNYVVVAPTAAWGSKRWPVEHFDAVINRLGELGFEHCVIVGAESERGQVLPLFEPGKSTVRRVDMMGKTTVGQLMALLDRAAMVIANDSAALHIAMGLGNKCVGIFGPTDPAKVGPYRYSTGLVAADRAESIHYRAMRDDPSLIASIPVERVLVSAHRVLHSAPPATVHPA